MFNKANEYLETNVIMIYSVVDCWDGSNGEPIVYHGRTLTSKILFHDILSDAVKPYAFVKSSYPVILSLENHCSKEQQKRLAFHLHDILGGMFIHIGTIST
jgi:hypothetical protein